MRWKLVFAAIIIVIIAVIGFGYYVSDYYHAGDTAKQYINGTDNVSVIKTDDGLFLDGPGNDTALIFYPGAKVEYISYLPMFVDLSEKGVDCFLIEMPFNLAIFGKDSADHIIENYDYDDFFLSGHSLGGVMASDYVHNSEDITGLILFESYPTSEIKKPVLSIYATEDNVLDLQKYKDSRPLMGKNLTEVTIIGGNHAQIGDYGKQSGDGESTITSKEQQDLCVEAMKIFIDKFSN